LFKNKKILALVAVRSGSKSINNKNLKLLNRKPFIKYILDFVNKLNFIDTKAVSLDNIKIPKLAQKNKPIYLNKILPVIINYKMVNIYNLHDLKIVRKLIHKKI